MGGLGQQHSILSSLRAGCWRDALWGRALCKGASNSGVSSRSPFPSSLPVSTFMTPSYEDTAVGFRTKPNLNPINLQESCFQTRLPPRDLRVHA